MIQYQLPAYQYNDIRLIYKTPNNSTKMESDPPHTTLVSPWKWCVAFVNIHSLRVYDMKKSAEIASPTQRATAANGNIGTFHQTSLHTKQHICLRYPFFCVFLEPPLVSAQSNLFPNSAVLVTPPRRSSNIGTSQSHQLRMLIPEYWDGNERKGPKSQPR